MMPPVFIAAIGSPGTIWAPSTTHAIQTAVSAPRPRAVVPGCRAASRVSRRVAIAIRASRPAASSTARLAAPMAPARPNDSLRNSTA